MATFDEMLACTQATPVYVLEWDYRAHVLGAELAAGDLALTGAADTFNGWPSFGYAEFDDGSGEIIAWSGVSEDGSTLQNLRRGLHGSGALAHAPGVRLREYGFWRPLLSKPHPDFPDGLDVLRPPRLGTLGFDPQKRAASLSGTSLTLVEASHPEESRAAFLADLVAHANGAHGNGIRDRRVVLKLGFEELGPGGEFRVIARGIATAMQVQRQGTEFALQLRPLHGELKDRRLLAAHQTRLSALVSDSATTIGVADASALIDPAGGTAYARVEEEFLSYTGISGNNLMGVTRGLFGSIASGHDADEPLDQVRYFGSEHPLTRFLQILTSTGEGGNGAYDVLRSDEGLGIDASLINVTAIEAIRDDLASQALAAFVIGEEIDDAKGWLEEQLLVPAGCTLSVDGNERITVAFYGPPLPAETLVPLGADDALSGASLNADLGFSDVLNVVEVRYSLDPVSEKYLGRVLMIDNDSIQAHGSAKKLTLELDGVHGIDSVVAPDPAGDSVAELVASRLLSRYAVPRKELSWNAPLTRAATPVANLIEVSEDRLPATVVDEARRRHLSKGNEGVLYEVVSRSVDYARGVVGLGLLESEFTGERYLFLNDDAAPDYVVATTEQRRFGYLAADDDDAMSLNENPLPFADGGEAYRIYPA